MMSQLTDWFMPYHHWQFLCICWKIVARHENCKTTSFFIHLQWFFLPQFASHILLQTMKILTFYQQSTHRRQKHVAINWVCWLGRNIPVTPPSHHIAIPLYHVNLHRLLWKVFNPLLWLLRRWDINPIPWFVFCSPNIILIIINHNVNHNINLLF